MHTPQHPGFPFDVPFAVSIEDAKARAKVHPMEQLHDMYRYILKNGILQANRTKEEAIFVPGYALYFDMADGAPAVTSKRLAFKAARGEFIGLVKGFDNAQQFADVGCNVWFKNANETEPWVSSIFRKGDDDLGRIYGPQWAKWNDYKVATTAEEVAYFEKNGYSLVANDAGRGVKVYHRFINQLEDSVRLLMTSPESRRIMLTGWNPAELSMGALPSCHVLYALNCDLARKELHLSVFQRSYDSFLAFNPMLNAMYLGVMAKLAGMRPRTISHFIANSHIYTPHIPQVEEMLTRSHFAQPELVLGESIKTLQSVDEIPDCFMRINHEDITLQGYQSHGALTGVMMA